MTSYALLTDRTEDRSLARELAARSGVSIFPLRRALAEGTPILRFELPATASDALTHAQTLCSVMHMLSSRGMRIRFTDSEGRDIAPAAVLRAHRDRVGLDADPRSRVHSQPA